MTRQFTKGDAILQDIRDIRVTRSGLTVQVRKDPARPGFLTGVIHHANYNGKPTHWNAKTGEHVLSRVDDLVLTLDEYNTRRNYIAPSRA